MFTSARIASLLARPWRWRQSRTGLEIRRDALIVQVQKFPFLFRFWVDPIYLGQEWNAVDDPGDSPAVVGRPLAGAYRKGSIQWRGIAQRVPQIIRPEDSDSPAISCRTAVRIEESDIERHWLPTSGYCRIHSNRGDVNCRRNEHRRRWRRRRCRGHRGR